MVAVASIRDTRSGTALVTESRGWWRMSNHLWTAVALLLGTGALVGIFRLARGDWSWRRP